MEPGGRRERLEALLDGIPLLVLPGDVRAFDGERRTVRLRRGVSEASISTVEARIGRGDSNGALEVFEPLDPGFLASINPYLSTSLPLISSQSSMPPASSNGSF